MAELPHAAAKYHQTACGKIKTLKESLRSTRSLEDLEQIKVTVMALEKSVLEATIKGLRMEINVLENGIISIQKWGCFDKQMFPKILRFLKL